MSGGEGLPGLYGVIGVPECSWKDPASVVKTNKNVSGGSWPILVYHISRSPQPVVAAQLIRRIHDQQIMLVWINDLAAHCHWREQTSSYSHQLQNLGYYLIPSDTLKNVVEERVWGPETRNT